MSRSTTSKPDVVYVGYTPGLHLELRLPRLCGLRHRLVVPALLGTSLLLPLPLDLGLPRALEPLVRLELRPELFDRPPLPSRLALGVGDDTGTGVGGDRVATGPTRDTDTVPASGPVTATATARATATAQLRGVDRPRMGGLRPNNNIYSRPGNTDRVARTQDRSGTRQQPSGGARPGEQRLYRQER